MDDLVDEIKLCNRRPLLLHGYVLPFILLYALWAYVWIGVLGFTDYMEPGCIVCVGISLLQILTALFCYWSVTITYVLTCSQASSAETATYVAVYPTPNNGSAEIVALLKNEGSISFEFQKTHYFYDPDGKKLFRPVEFPIDLRMEEYQNGKGYQNDITIKHAIARYGSNNMEMGVATFIELFTERATAPFFVFQVFCVGLWCLDEYWYYSVFTLMMLVAFEATLVKQQMKNMAEIRNMGNKPALINVYRFKRWSKIPSDTLVAGDIVSVGRSTDEHPIPCDLLLVRGQCIVDESMLTGESIPQMKEPIEQVDSELYFDIDSDAKLRVIN